MRIKDFLKKNNALTKEISNTDYHMSLLDTDIDELKRRIKELREKDDQEILNYILWIYKVCNSLNPEYDGKIDEEMTRIGLETDKFYGSHNHNIWNNGMFHDDGFGFGTEPTSIYDDYIDSQSGLKR